MNTRYDRQMVACEPIRKQMNATVDFLNETLSRVTPEGMGNGSLGTSLRASIQMLEQALKMVRDTSIEPREEGGPEPRFKLTR